MKSTSRLIVILSMFLLMFGLGPRPLPESGLATPNQIIEENKKQGTTSWMAPILQTPMDTWDRGKYSGLYADSGREMSSGLMDWSTWTIRGYAGKSSINKGESVTLHISTSHPTYNIDVYRMGWYNGTGGRYIMGVANLTGQNSAVPTADPLTGMLDANWPVSYTLQTGSDWVSGYYLIKLTASDQTINYIPLIVRDDSSDSDVLYQVALTTYQAYNNWGGKSLYDSNSTGGRAYKVSYNRPYADWWGAGHFFSGDYGMIRFLESKGYNITYATNIDTHNNPDLMDSHKVFLSNWHDEYWSKEMRDNITTARDAGKHLAFFTGNSVYWQIRFENDASGNPYRVQTCYKDATLDPLSASDPSRTTVLWRDPPVNKPENELLGVMYGDVLSTNRFDWVVQNSSHWIYDGTGLSDGSIITQVIGNESDRIYNNGLTPANIVILSNSPVLGGMYANSSMYTAPSGALVFDAANIEWSLNVDKNEYMNFSKNEPSIQRMTTNLLDHMLGEAPVFEIQDSVMYDDGFWFHWYNPTSANSIRDFASTAQVYSGLKSIAFTALNASAVLRFESDQGVWTSPYTHLKFAVYGTTSTQKLGVALRDMSYTELTPYLSLADYGGQPTPNQWKVYTIPLSSLNASNMNISGLALANTSGSAQPILYVDEVKLIKAPFVSSIARVSASPTNVASVAFTVTFSESVTGVDPGDFTLTTVGVSGAAITGVSGSGSTRTVTANTGTGNGTIRLDVVDNDSIQDTSSNLLGGPGTGNGSFIGTQSYTIDKTAPVITISNPNITPAQSKTITASSSDGTLTMRITTGSVCDASLTFISYSSQIFTSESDNGKKICYQATDSLGNTAYSLSNAIAGIDTTAPTTQINSNPPNLSPSTTASFTFSSPDLTAVFECSLDSRPYSACTTPHQIINLTDGSYTLLIRAKDAAGNLDATPVSFTWMIDATSPTVSSIIRTSASPTNAASVDFTVTFPESVSGVNTSTPFSDFSLTTTGVTGATITSVSGSGATYTVTVNTGLGNGTVRLDVADDDSIKDAANNPLGGVNAGNANFMAGEVYTVIKGFYVSGRYLLDANGNNFIMRGVNHGHNWYPDQTSVFADIKAKGANTVRVVLSSGQNWSKNSASDVANVISSCKANKLICVLEVHDTTGYGEDAGAVNLAQAVNYWKEIKSVLDGQEAYVIINIGNEPYGNTNPSGWINDTKSAIAEMRNAGFQHTLMVDAPNWGQDWQFIMRDNAADIFNSDAKRNLVFSIHMYGVFNTPDKIQNYVSTFVNAGLPLVIGEFAHQHTDGDPDENAIIAVAQANGIGYLGWVWSGGGYLDMVNNFDPNQETLWGSRIVNGEYGIRKTSCEASVYGENPNPRICFISRANPNPASVTSVNFTVIFSESVTGVNTSAPFNDFALTTTGVTGTAITGVSGSGATYTVTVNTGSGTGTIRLDGVDDDSIKDVENNPLGGVGTGNGNYTGGEIYNIVKTSIMGNAGVGGVTLSYYVDGTPKIVISDGSGNYTISVPYGWSGTVTPSLNTDAFCPVSQTYTNLLTVRTGQNYAHDACRTFDPISKWTSAFDLSHGWTVASYVRMVGDVNNDGKDDLVGFGQDGVYVALSNGTSFDAISKWTSAFDLSHGWTVASYVRTVGDVNNDGRADLIGFGQDGVYVALSNGTSFDAISKWTSAFDLSHGWTVKDYVRTVGDVNNDGRADLIGFGQDGVYVALSNGTSFGAISKWTSAFDLSHGWTVASYVRTVGDVNNDGRADLIGFGQDGVYVALSNGTSFGAISKWTSAFDLSHGWTVASYVRTVGDVNNDGRVDLIGFGQDGVYIALSMGTTFSLPSRRTTSFDLAHGWTVASYVRTVGDVSGDGKADLVGFGLDGVYVVK